MIDFGGFVGWGGRVFERLVEVGVKPWGPGAMMKRIAPSLAEDPVAIAQFAKFERLSASPGAVKSFMKLNWQIDVSLILPAVRVPTLVLHRRNDANVPIELGRELAALIPDAKFIEYPGSDHSFVQGDVEALIGDIEEFITGNRDRSSAPLERVLATFRFTVISS